MCEHSNSQPYSGAGQASEVKLPPLPPPLDEANIVRHTPPLQHDDFMPPSIEPSPELNARLAERDRYLATLAFNEQGDMNRYPYRKEDENGPNA